MLQICIGSTNYSSLIIKLLCMAVLDMYDFDMHNGANYHCIANLHWLRVFQSLKLVILDIMEKLDLSYDIKWSSN